MKNTFKTLAFSTVLIAVSSSALAAYSLHENSDSTTMDISVNVPEMVSITKPNDISLKFTGSGDLVGTSNFCIASNHATDKVKLQIGNSLGSSYGVTPKSFYLMQAGSGSIANPNKVLPFTVSYKSGKDTFDMDNNAVKTVTGAKWLIDCNATPNTGSSIVINIKEADAQHVYAGDYMSTLTVTVTPE